MKRKPLRVYDHITIGLVGAAVAFAFRGSGSIKTIPFSYLMVIGILAFAFLLREFHAANRETIHKMQKEIDDLKLQVSRFRDFSVIDVDPQEHEEVGVRKLDR